jgi:hypothetical protein
VRQHPSRGPYVEGLTVAPVKDYKQLEAFMEAGNSSRTVASTLDERNFLAQSRGLHHVSRAIKNAHARTNKHSHKTTKHCAIYITLC